MMDLITIEEARLAVEKWGSARQTDMMIEEIGEFLAAWNHFKRDRITYDEYVSEIADMYIMIQQMMFMHWDKFTEVYPKKLAKIRKKLDGLNPSTLEEIVDKVVEINSPTLYAKAKQEEKDENI